MLKYVLRRILFLIPVVLGVSFIVFTMLYLTPGDPAALVLGDQASKEQVDLLRQEILTGPLVNCDETRLQVLDEPGREPTDESYVCLLSENPKTCLDCSAIILTLSESARSQLHPW